MYVRTQRRPANRTLGSWWNPLSSDNAIAVAGYYLLHGGTSMPTPLPSATPPPASVDDGTSLFIPGSSFTDILKNAVTGKPTAAQIAVNTTSCIQSIQNMRQLAAQQGKPDPIPAGTEQKCVTDQQAYVNLIGGTADKQTSPTLWAWVIMAGVVGGVYFMTR